MKVLSYSVFLLVVTNSILFADDRISGKSQRRARSCAQTTAALAKGDGRSTESAKTEDTIYVLDTNTFHHNPNVLDQFPGSEIYISQTVLDELDHQKTSTNLQVAGTARAISSTLEQLRKKNGGKVTHLEHNGSRISLVALKDETPWPQHLERTNDNQIILLAKQVQDELAPKGKRVVLITGDNGMALRAANRGIQFVEGLPDATRNHSATQDLLERPITVEVSREVAIDLGRKTSLTLEDAREFGLDPTITPRENQFIVFANSGMKSSFVNGGMHGKPLEPDTDALKAALRMVWRFHGDPEGDHYFTPANQEILSMPVLPRNIEQIMLADLLFDNKIGVITAAGVAGSGKTLISLAAAMTQSTLLGKRRFEKIILLRPNEPVGRDTGFLPGDLWEKHFALMGPFRDNLSLVISAIRNGGALKVGSRTPTSGKTDSAESLLREEIFGSVTPDEVADHLLGIKSPFFSVGAISHSRGRSWNKSLIIVDEAQNLDVHIAKTLGTRVGEGSVILFIGDPEQIDVRNINSVNCGLVAVANSFRNGRLDRGDGREIAGHVTLETSERSQVAALMAKLLKH